MHARSAGGFGSLGQLVLEARAPLQLELDIVGEANAATYADRSNQFDMVLDIRLHPPGPGCSVCRVLEAWVGHFLAVAIAIRCRLRRIRTALASQAWTPRRQHCSTNSMPATTSATRRRGALSLFSGGTKELVRVDGTRRFTWAWHRTSADAPAEAADMLVNLPLARAT